MSEARARPATAYLLLQGLQRRLERFNLELGIRHSRLSSTALVLLLRDHLMKMLQLELRAVALCFGFGCGGVERSLGRMVRSNGAIEQC